ncbi:MAG: ATP-binding protein [Candidatus Omnitrophica bacterium]|nr:ATP-binding protein [Candidatus Omnitrophota bacterium]
MKYIPRHIEKTLREYLKIFPAVSLTGPRQSGKSTTLREMFGDKYTYVSFDDPLTLDYFAQDPKGFMRQYANHVIFDEAQKAPLLFNYLKIAIDEDRHNYGKFILTGSSQFSLIKQITETLAGRIGALSLLPFHLTELPEKWRKQQILKGSYPELVHLKYEKTSEWCGAYINHYIERDVRNIANIGNLSDFQRLIKLLAARVSQELNVSSLANDIGVTVRTVQNWISILEASYIVFLVPSYHKNLGKRIVKRPKLYFYDLGLVCYFTGIEEEAVLRKGPLDGPIFENYIVTEIKKWIMHHGLKDQLFYFRTNLGIEVDLIIENLTENELQLIEIKSTETARPEMFRNILKVKELESQKQKRDKKIRNILIYRGETIEKFQEKGRCVNYFDFFK